MPYTITITDNNPQALHLVRYLKTLDFVKVTKQKEPKYSQEVLDDSKVLKMTPEEIVEAAKEEEMTPEDYAFVMTISKKINKKVSQRLRERFNL